MTATHSGVPEGVAQDVEAPAAQQATVGPLTGDPAIVGVPTFVVGSVMLGLALINYNPAVGAALPIIIMATGIGQLVAAVWAGAIGQSAVAAIFGIFSGFWFSYAALVTGLLHGWWGLTAATTVHAVAAFLISWLVIIGALTLGSLRLPAAFTAIFALIDVALILDLAGTVNGSPGLVKAAGILVFCFAAIGTYVFAGSLSVATGGKPFPLGRPVITLARDRGDSRPAAVRPSPHAHSLAAGQTGSPAFPGEQSPTGVHAVTAAAGEARTCPRVSCGLSFCGRPATAVLHRCCFPAGSGAIRVPGEEPVPIIRDNGL